MALSGQLSDLSLAELIEFFCNQRKTGRLKIAYQRAPGYFYFDRGELVDAKIGALSGVDAVYYALTQENASFKFSTAFEATRRTIHRPWAHVALEGLRRLDEGVTPKEAFPEGMPPVHDDEPEDAEERPRTERAAVAEKLEVPQSAEPEPASSPLQLTVEGSSGGGRSRALVYAAVIGALLISVAAIGFPAGWYGKRKAVATATPAAASSEAKADASAPAVTENNPSDSSAAQTEAVPSDTTGGATSDTNNLALRQQQEREARAAYLAAQERANAQQAARQNATAQPQPAAASAGEVKKPETAAPAQKKTVTVQVTYDENGRVTQASGGDGMAQRIARQKRFPTGKAGTATVTIPVN